MRQWIIISILFNSILFIVPLPSLKDRGKAMVDVVKMTYRFKKIPKEEPLERKIRQGEFVKISQRLKKISSSHEKNIFQNQNPPIYFFSFNLSRDEKSSFKVASLSPSLKIYSLPILPAARKRKIASTCEKISLKKNKLPLIYKIGGSLIREYHLPVEPLIYQSLSLRYLHLKNPVVPPNSLTNYHFLNTQHLPFSFQKNTGILTFPEFHQLKEVFSLRKREITSYPHVKLKVPQKLFKLEKRPFFKTTTAINLPGYLKEQVSLFFKNQQIKRISTKKKLLILVMTEENFIFSSSKNLIIPPPKLPEGKFYHRGVAPSSFSVLKMPLSSSSFTPDHLFKKAESISNFVFLPENNSPSIYNFLEPLLPDTNYSKLINSYLKEIIEIINKNKKYPSLARKKGEEGGVEVSFKLLKDGKAENVKIISPSKYAELNKAAEKLIYHLSPFPPFSSGINKNAINIKMEVIYELKEEY